MSFVPFPSLLLRSWPLPSLSFLFSLLCPSDRKRKEMTPRAGQSAQLECMCVCVCACLCVLVFLSPLLLSHRPIIPCERSWSLGSRYHRDIACQDRKDQQLSPLRRETRTAVTFTLFAHMFALSHLAWSPIKRGCNHNNPARSSPLFSPFEWSGHTHEPRPFQP